MAVRAIPLALGGAERQLRFGLGAWAALEDHGYDFAGLLSALQAGPKKHSALRLILWAMLQEETPVPTVVEVGRWVDGHNYLDVLHAVNQALELSFPQPRPTAESPPSDPPPGGGIGPPSAASLPARSDSPPPTSGG